MCRGGGSVPGDDGGGATVCCEPNTTAVLDDGGGVTTLWYAISGQRELASDYVEEGRCEETWREDGTIRCEHLCNSFSSLFCFLGLRGCSIIIHRCTSLPIRLSLYFFPTSFIFSWNKIPQHVSTHAQQ